MKTDILYLNVLKKLKIPLNMNYPIKNTPNRYFYTITWHHKDSRKILTILYKISDATMEKRLDINSLRDSDS